MPLVFPVLRILQKLWGGPPRLRGSPWTRSSQRDQSHPNGKAGQGAVRGPGGPPHNFCRLFADRPVMGKTSGIGLAASSRFLAGLLLRLAKSELPGHRNSPMYFAILAALCQAAVPTPHSHLGFTPGDDY